MADFYNLNNQRYRDIISSSSIPVTYKVDILDSYDEILFELTDYISEDNGSISINYKQGIRRTCNVTLLDIDGTLFPRANGIIWINTKIKIYIGIRDIYNNDTYWFSQGVFYIYNPTIDREGRTITLSGVDKFGLLGGELGYNALTSTHVMQEGVNVRQFINDTLMIDLGNGFPIDSARAIIDMNIGNTSFPYEMTKSPNTYLGEMFIDIGNALGADVYYDVEGRMRYTSGLLESSYAFEPSVWNFKDVLPEYSNPTISTNTVDVINSVTIVGNNSNIKELFESTVENFNPNSDFAVNKIGRKSYYEETPNIQIQKHADDYANLVLSQKSILQETITFECHIIPHIDVNQVISITDKYYDFEEQRFIIQSIDMPLNINSNMKLTVTNTAILPYYELREGGTTT